MASVARALSRIKSDLGPYLPGASIEDAKQKLEYDLYYIKNHSIFLDCIILLQTARVVLFPEGVR